MHGSLPVCRRGDGRFHPGTPALARFVAKCQFQPETGCVIWIGGQTKGRGHSVPYGAFWDQGRRWFAHRWAARYIHGFEIDQLQVDHCCPNIALPNTLCVEHVQPLSSERNRWLQTARRRMYVHLEVGLASYEDIYGPPPDTEHELIPFYLEPAWLTRNRSPISA